MRRKSKRGGAQRTRIGKVSLYQHHGAWWLYYRDGGNPRRQRVGPNRDEAERIAAELNAQVTAAVPTMFAFEAITLRALVQKFLGYHEHVLRSSLATINRYRTALEHLTDFAPGEGAEAHKVAAAPFVAHLRSLVISPNGHPNTRKRKLRDKGLRYILEVCRTLYGFAQKNRHLPPYAPNPFAELPIDRLTVEDAKEVYVFTEATEADFLRAAPRSEFAVHALLAKTGMRPGELCHLLIEDIDLAAGWIHIRNKADLGWSIKTRNERSIPISRELRRLLLKVLDDRIRGLVFRRPRFIPLPGQSDVDRAGLRARFESAVASREANIARALTRSERQKLSERIWSEAGAIDPDRIRTSFIRITTRIGLRDVTCPKSWRHTFATLLQDANVDPLIRQITLGHKPRDAGNALGMTGIYTHSRPETQAREIDRALRLWPGSLELVARWADGKPL